MKKLMDRIGETVKGHIEEAKLSPLEDEIRKYMLREFAVNGRVPSTEKIMEEWKEKNSEFGDGEIYSLNEALEHGKTIFGDFLK